MNNRNGHIDCWKLVFDISSSCHILWIFDAMFLKNKKSTKYYKYVLQLFFRSFIFCIFTFYELWSMYEWVVFSHVRMLFTGVMCWPHVYCLLLHQCRPTKNMTEFINMHDLILIHNKKRKSRQFPNPTTCTIL